MKILAFIEIWNPNLNVHFDTVQEVAESEKAALEQFNRLSNVISKMSEDNNTILLETTTGYMIFTRKFLVDSIIRLKMEETGEE